VRLNTNRRGFTLIELLVVISIIAVLAALLFPAINAAMKRADITRAKTEMNNIKTAILSYYKDYGFMPAPGRNGSQDSDYGMKQLPGNSTPDDQSIVMNILTARDTTNNPNRKVYLQIPEESLVGVDMNGDSYTPANNYFLDPWGNPYQIIMDTDADTVILFSRLQTPLQVWNIVEIIGHKVGVVSYGPPTGGNSAGSNNKASYDISRALTTFTPP